jgi:hypothetical protein
MILLLRYKGNAHILFLKGADLKQGPFKVLGIGVLRHRFGKGFVLSLGCNMDRAMR